MGPSFGFGLRGVDGVTGLAFNAGGARSGGPNFVPLNQASFADGFTVVVAFDDERWTISLTGLEDAAGNPVNGGTGLFADIGFQFEDFTDTMRVSATTQGPAGVLDLASVTVVQAPITDTDGDGLTDAYELANGLNPDDGTDAALDNDADGGPDGLSNLREFMAGTDPQDSDSDDDGLLDGQ